MPQQPSFPSSKRKRVSYTAAFKLKAIKLAEDTNNSKAARAYDLDESTIRGWRKNKSQLEEGPKTKRANRGPKEGKHPELEQAVFDWFEAQSQSGYNVSRLAIRFRALRLAKSGKFPAESFTASQGWCTRFMKRNQLSLRQRTKIAQKLPHELDEKVLSFQKYVIVRRKFFEFPLSRIGNMDETPMFFYMPGTRTVNKAGEKTVLVRTTGNEKNHFTVVLACMADGTKLPPMVIFKRRTMPKDKFPKGVVIHVCDSGWMDKDGIKLWLNKVWSRRDGGLLKKPSLLVWDQFRAHLTDDVRQCTRENKTVQAVIHGGLTGMLQPLDVSLNKPFKVNMRHLWQEWMSEGNAQLTAKGNFKRPPLPTVVSWVKKAWEDIPEAMIKKSFLKCCISNKMDGSEDDILWQDVEESDRETDEEDEDEERDIIGWDDDRLEYTAAEWTELFGESDAEEEFDGF